MALQKFPIQIRLDVDELEALDQYVASFADFPPTRVAVVHRALREWLAEKTARISAGPAVPSALELAGREAAPSLVHVDTAAPTTLPAEVLEELPPAQPAVPLARLPASDADGSLRPIVTSDEDALPAPPPPTKRSGTAKPLTSRKHAQRKGGKGRTT